MKHFVLIVFLLLGIVRQSSGAHLVGGEIFYECLGNNQYVITLTMYRDCNGNGAPFDQNVRIAIYRSSNKSLLSVLNIPFSGIIDTLPFTQNIPCLVDTPDVCISTTSYRDTVLLDIPLGGLDLVHQRCCRPPNVINIINVASIGSTYHAFIPDSTVAPCNSSPYFNFVPPIALCAELYMNIDYSATDKDGDSLVYSLCRPYHGGTNNNPVPNPPTPPPFQNVPWAFGFNDQNQITALPQVNIDSDGMLTGRPTQIGTFAFGICVQEWRDGIFISENKRDFQLTTTYCEVDAVAAIDSALEACIGFEIQFFNLSTLGDSFSWDFGVDNTLDDTSSFENPIYTFPDTGTYWITLVSYGDVCNDTTRLEYRVQHKIEPFFEVPHPDCLDGHRYVFLPEGFYRETTQMRWEFIGDTALIGDGDVPSATKIYDTTGFHQITLHYNDPELGCYRSYSDSVEVWPNPTLAIVEPPDEKCAPFTGSFSSTISNAYLPRYQWFLDSTLISDSSTAFVESFEIGPHDLRIILITDSMCIDTIDLLYTAHINTLDTPSAGFTLDKLLANMYEPNFTLYDESVNRSSWKFLIDSAYVSPNATYRFTLPDTGNYLVTQIAENQTGCKDTLSQIIRVSPEYLTFIPNSFTPNGDGFNDVWRPSVFVHNTYQLSIYDRWGHLIFTTTDVDQGWDGKKSAGGERCQTGTYTYDLFITDEFDRPFYYKGSVHLLR